MPAALRTTKATRRARPRPCWLFVPTCCVIVAAVYAMVGGVPKSEHPSFYYHGWPVIFMIRTGPFAGGSVASWSGTAFALDAIVCMTATVSAFVVSYKTHCALGANARFHLLDLFIAITAIATILGIAVTERSWPAPSQVSSHVKRPPVAPRSNDLQTPRAHVFQPLAVRLPIYAGLGCAFWIVIHALVRRPLSNGSERRKREQGNGDEQRNMDDQPNGNGPID